MALKGGCAMKNNRVFALLLIIATLLSGCGKQLPDATDPAAGSTPPQQQNAPDTTPSTQPTTASALTLEEEFQKLIRDNYWYWRALGCIFEKPEEIPTRLYFYLGVGDHTQATGEELDYILNAYKQKNPNGWEDYGHEYTRVPIAKMNEALNVLGVTVEDIQIPDNWAYNEKLDCYYFWVSDAYGVDQWSVTKVEKGDSGKVTVYWETDARIFGFETPSAITMVLTMQEQSDGTYRILSNVPQE